MRKFVFIGIGGFLGAIIRFVMKNWQMLSIGGPLQANIFVINIIGCFALAMFLGIAFDNRKADIDFRLGISTGLIGAFTTFSTLCREIVDLFTGGYILTAILYSVMSIAVGLAAVYLGEACAKKLLQIGKQYMGTSKSE